MSCTPPRYACVIVLNIIPFPHLNGLPVKDPDILCPSDHVAGVEYEHSVVSCVSVFTCAWLREPFNCVVLGDLLHVMGRGGEGGGRKGGRGGREGGGREGGSE